MGWFYTLLIVGSDLHHSGGTVGIATGRPVAFTQTGVAGENMGPAVLAAEYSPLAEHSKTVKCSRPCLTNGGICQYAVVEGHINAVVVSIKGHGFHIDVGVQQFCTPHLCAGSRIQQALRALGQIDPQVLDAILVTAAVCDLSGVDGHRLLKIAGIAAEGVLTFFGHR